MKFLNHSILSYSGNEQTCSSEEVQTVAAPPPGLSHGDPSLSKTQCGQFSLLQHRPPAGSGLTETIFEG